MQLLILITCMCQLNHSVGVLTLTTSPLPGLPKILPSGWEATAFVYRITSISCGRRLKIPKWVSRLYNTVPKLASTTQQWLDSLLNSSIWLTKALFFLKKLELYLMECVVVIHWWRRFVYHVLCRDGVTVYFLPQNFPPIRGWVEYKWSRHASHVFI